MDHPHHSAVVVVAVVDPAPRLRTVVATVARPRTVTSTDCTVDNTLRCILAHSRLVAVVDMHQLLRMRCLLNNINRDQDTRQYQLLPPMTCCATC